MNKLIRLIDENALSSENGIVFNAAQKEAILHDKGPMLVLAGPGSGKTAVITHRINSLIEKYHAAPEKILVVTFSRAAASEMKRRFSILNPKQCGSVHFGTFHAIFFNILKAVYRYDGSNIIREDEKYLILRDLIRSKKIISDSERETIDKIASAISTVKSEKTEPWQYRIRICKSEDFEEMYRKYSEYLISESKLDFDDMMLQCEALFEREPDILREWQSRYEYILVDEFQDINCLQYKLVKMLAEPENNLFAVGDDDQSIYGFRGAKPEIMLGFERDFAKSVSKCEKVLLDINYRSHDEILERAGVLISHNRTRFPKNVKGCRGQGGVFEYKNFETLEDENRYIVDFMRDYISAGNSPSNTAVLYRMNHEARSLYRAMTIAGIPCKIGENVPCVYDHWIAEDMIIYMKLARGDRLTADVLRVINRPARYVTRDSVQRAQSYGAADDVQRLRSDGAGDDVQRFRSDGAEVSFEKLLELNREKGYVVTELQKLIAQLGFLRKLDPMASIKFIRHAVGYDGYLRKYAEEKQVAAEELFEIIGELEESAKPYRSLEEWLEAIEEYRRLLKAKKGGKQNSDNTQNPQNLQNSQILQNPTAAAKQEMKVPAEEENAVNFMTFHASKGLEFDVVFIIDLVEGSVPTKRAETTEEIEEERRTLYVAMTRARKQLYMLSSTDRLGRRTELSRFVRELGEGREGDTKK